MKANRLRITLSIGLSLIVAGCPCWAEEGLREDPTLEDETNYEDLLADLEDMSVDLNAASVDDLRRLPGLSKKEAQAIVMFRRQHGPFRRSKDVNQVEGLSEETIETISPYLTVSGVGELEIAVQSRIRGIWDRSKGGPDLWTKTQMYQRTEVTVGRRARLLVVTEKDPGEAHLTDFSAGYVELRDLPGSGHLVLGDFRPGFAQGLVFSRWSRSGGSVERLKREDSKAVGYRSSTENGALRGGFLRMFMGSVDATIWLSNAGFDAKVNEAGVVIGLDESGLHRTPAERSKADVLTERLLGLRFGLKSGSMVKTGLTLSYAIFDPPFQRTDPVRKRFAFQGSRNQVIGMDWDLTHDRLNLYGEVAFARTSPALLVGLTLDLDRMQVNLLGRRYSRDFHNIHGGGFSMLSGENRNEIGVLSVLSWRPIRSVAVTVYFDQYRCPWRRYFLPLPSQGTRAGVFLKLRCPRRVLIHLRARSKYTQEWHRGLADAKRKELRVDLSWRPQKQLRLRGRAERVWVPRTGAEIPHEVGSAGFGDLRLRFGRALSLEGRLTCFRTDSYRSRIYEFEGDHTGIAFSRSLNGKGAKGYVLLKAKFRGVQLSAKYRKVIAGGKSGRGTSQFSLQTELRR